ncbi:MAG: Hpt domain-containing protein [Rhodocyclaceae bacterium]|jgi:two-component system chemotaxis sensor kinase CheA|nr:Hpt domain-containing protein [Rhodocyclaceae bacterium]MBK6908355.1 Hpt domain-containing protein [Rhodocyclaceae bacterium]
MTSSFFNKYKFLIAAIGLFFVLSVGIFSLNYVLSFQLAEDGGKINDSGRLRGFTQQNAKAILSLYQELSQSAPIQTSQAQIEESAAAIQATLARSRGRVGPDTPKEEIELLEKFAKVWAPMDELSQGLVRSEAPELAAAEAAQNRSNATNVRLLQIADDLTAHLESAALARANRLKLTQAMAITAASVIFLFIVVYALRSLSRSDRKAELAQRETSQILATVREGLFLVDNAYCVGSQRSNQLDAVFPRPLPANAKFLEVLEPLVSSETMESVSNYMGLLFNKRVKPGLIAALNPLKRVEIADRREPGQFSLFLSFGFTPVMDDAGTTVNALLVSVVDVSQEVYLERELESAEARAQSEMALLLGVLENDPAIVGEFLVEAGQKIDALNDMLRHVDPTVTSYAQVLNDVFRTIHSIKGEASALSLGPVSEEAHRFEDILTPLRRKALAGEDLIPVATSLGSMQQAVLKVRRITDRISTYAAGQEAVPHTADEDVQHTVQRIQRLALAVAADLNKSVRVETSLGHVDEVPDSIQRLLREGLPQLVRNAVVHGIEPANERTTSGKGVEGTIRIEFKKLEGGALELSVNDDGRGIDVMKLRAKLVSSGQRSAQQAAAMTDREVVSTIFEPGVSTADEVDAHAGRGVGLDVLLNLVRSTGARLRVASTPLKSTRFTIQWSPAV